MERYNRLLRFSRIGILALTLLAVLARTLALCLAFDASPGYFQSGAVLPVLYYIIIGLCVVSFCALPFIAREYETVPCRVPLSLGRLVAAGVCALLCGVNCVYLLTSVDTLAVPAVIATPAILALLAGVAYFALHFLGERYTSARVLCGYGFLLGCVLLLSITYFDRYTPMNAPHKVGTHVALLAMAASTLYELRATLSPRPSRALSVTSLLALALTASVGVSGVIAYLAGIYENTTYLVQDLLITGFALWIGTRVLAGAESEEPQ